MTDMRTSHQKMLDLEEENERLKAMVADDRRFCLCGCPVEEHENYGEDGESCGDGDHVCLRVPAAVAAAFAEYERLRAALEDLLGHAEMTDIHSYTTCTPGDSDNADRGCPACLAVKALKGE